MAYEHYKNREDFDSTFFLVLDADGVVPHEILNVINAEIVPNIDYYQVPHLWFKNYSEIRSILMKGFCYLQTYKVFSEEIPKISGWFFPFRAKYFIGNGMVIKGSLFKKVSGFKDFVEDVRLGHMCSFLNIPSKVIPCFTLTETAPRYSILFKQSSNWFFGCNMFIKDFIEAKKIDPRLSLYKSFFKINNILYENLRWMFKPLIILSLIIYSLYIDNSTLFQFNSLTYLLSSLIPAILIWRKQMSYIKGYISVSNIDLILGIAGSMIVFPIYSLGTFLGAFKIINYIINKKVDIYKTERI